jgi:hypothetical protein
VPHHKQVSAAVRANQAHYCCISGCTEHRFTVSPYCRNHRDNAQRWGDPLGTPVRPQQWAPYRAKVRELFSANPDHKGVADAVRLLHGWMLNADCQDGREAWATEVARVRRFGVSAMDVLVEFTACWLLLQDQPQLTRSDNHRSFVLAKAVTQLAPRPRLPAERSPTSKGYAKKPKAAALRQISSDLNKTFPRFLVAAHAAISGQQDLARTELDAMGAPFKSPLSALQAINSTTQKDQA